MKLLERLNEAVTRLEEKENYPVYHKSYSKALDAVKSFIAKNKMYCSDDDFAQGFGIDVSKPSEGKTVVGVILLFLDEELDMIAKKSLHVQIYGMGNSYELNMYFSTAKEKDYVGSTVSAYVKGSK